jgi:hypothetical protein
MMESKELRIGNLVYYGKENEIHEVSPYGLFTNEEVRTLPYSPIPLTDEWLVKFGFKRIIFCKNERDQEFINVGYVFNEYEPNEYDPYLIMDLVYGYQLALFTDDNEDYITFEARPFHFVHQLQNLYFALTGEELTIKQ